MKRKSLTDCLGRNPKLKLIGFLIENMDCSWRLKDIEKKIRVDAVPLRYLLLKLLNEGVIIVVAGKKKHEEYTINQDNFIAQKLIEISDYLMMGEHFFDCEESDEDCE